MTIIPIKSCPSPSEIIERWGLTQISDESAIVEVVERVLADNPQAAFDWEDGKKTAFNALMGAAMRETKGRADPKVLRAILNERLSEEGNDEQ